MGCAASTQTARKIHFSQVVPDDDLEHKDAKQSDDIPMDHRDVKAKWPHTERQQSNETSGQISSVAGDMPAAQPLEEEPALLRRQEVDGDSSRTLSQRPTQQHNETSEQISSVVGDVPAAQPLEEEPALLRRPGVDGDSSRTLQEVSQRPDTQSLDREEGELPNRQGECQGIILSANMVSEPKLLVSWNSYDYMPCDEDIGHQIPPCVLTHKRHLRRLRLRSRMIDAMPVTFHHLITLKRDMFDRHAQALDEEYAEKKEPCEDFISNESW
eukprot:TRINITY_DN5169_c0_g1_i12.p1 TRINITY_DN5169_c0_g1~~TRINITY_DN5169_c0_g1_i12.p1  ORF type:complete len:270 (-),score=43.44 TRINITY_DN5169_c0_g1_i12:132-941(-)